MTEHEICEYLNRVFKAGAAARRDGSNIPYAATEELKSMIHIFGWVQEDLRLALMKADPIYRIGQLAYEIANAQQ